MYTRPVVILGTIISRLIGLNALAAAMFFGFVAEGRIRWSGRSSITIGESHLSNLNEFATFSSSVCAVLTLVFLIPDFSNWFLRRRGFVLSVIFAPFQMTAAILVVSCFAIIATTALGGSDHVWGVYVVTVSAAFFVLYILPGAAAHRPEIPEDIPLAYRQRTPEEVLAYRTLHTRTDGGAAAEAALEERRERLIAKANRAATPRELLMRKDGMSKGRRLLLTVLALPFLIISAAGISSRFTHTFLPTEEVSNFANDLILPMGGYFFLLVVVAMMLGGRIHSPFPILRNRFVAFLILPVLAPLVSFVMSYPAVSTTAPWLHASFVGGPPASARVLVAERSMGQRLCRRAVTVRVSQTARPHELCYVDEALWEKIRPGDALLLTGTATRYGLKYNSIRR